MLSYVILCYAMLCYAMLYCVYNGKSKTGIDKLKFLRDGFLATPSITAPINPVVANPVPIILAACIIFFNLSHKDFIVFPL